MENNQVKIQEKDMKYFFYLKKSRLQYFKEFINKDKISSIDYRYSLVKTNFKFLEDKPVYEISFKSS